MHKYPQNQSSVGSSGQTITTNVSPKPCLMRLHYISYRIKLGTELIQSLHGAPDFHFRGGGSIEPAKTGGGGGLGKKAQLTDTIVTIEKKLRSHCWQGLCTSDFVPMLGTPQLMWF